MVSGTIACASPRGHVSDRRPPNARCPRSSREDAADRPRAWRRRARPGPTLGVHGSACSHVRRGPRPLPKRRGEGRSAEFNQAGLRLVEHETRGSATSARAIEDHVSLAATWSRRHRPGGRRPRRDAGRAPRALRASRVRMCPRRARPSRHLGQWRRHVRCVRACGTVDRTRPSARVDIDPKWGADIGVSPAL